MNPRKKTPIILVPVRELAIGQWVVGNSGEPQQVTATIKRTLPAHAEVRAYAA